jgi:hypothetical protein
MKKEIHVLGLGPGIENYKDSLKYPVTTIGVNDIWKYFETDYVLCIDKLSAFTEERLLIITCCNPLKFFTCWPEWNFVRTLTGRHTLKIVLDDNPPGRGGLVESLDSEVRVPFHVDSTFTAACMAYRMIRNLPGEGRIVMFGCRFLGHYQLQSFIPAIQESYKRLYLALLERGITLYNADEKSALYDVLPFFEP